MNSDGSHDAVDSGGFGKDYHGQDVFGERAGSSGIGGDGHESSFDAPEIDTTELSNTESSFEGETTNAGTDMRESIQDINSTETENSNTGSMDTSFQIGGTEEDKEKYQQEFEEIDYETDKLALEKAKENLNFVEDWAAKQDVILTKSGELFDTAINKMDIDNKSITGKLTNSFSNMGGKLIDSLEKLAKQYGIDGFDRSKVEAIYKERGTEGLREVKDETYRSIQDYIDNTVKVTRDERDRLKNRVDSYESSIANKTKTSFTDKMEPSTTEAKPKAEAKAEPGKNMANAKTSPSDYLTKANKDSTKKEQSRDDLRNDYGNHISDTIKGAINRIGPVAVKPPEEWAKENGYDPSKLSTMMAYNAYHTKEIIKAVPKVMKEVGSYIEERVKDFFDPSKFGERIRNTIARYNGATLLGAAILGIKSGAGVQAAIDMALTMVDPSDVPEVREALGEALKDNSLVDDVSTLIDGAYSNINSSNQDDIDAEIVNIGRKDNTDYSGFNEGLGTSSDKDVKVFISRNVKSDPILRKMISKIGK